MLKLAITSIFLGATLFSFSTENTSFFSEIKSDANDPFYQYIGFGSVNLFSGDYFAALENFNRAESFREGPIELFWVSFGKAIAYDSLGMGDRCNQAIGSLFLTIYAFADEEDEESFEEEDDFTSQEATQAWEFMRQLASLAPSPNVRNLLVQLINDMEED
jgi:hypothetical protein